MRHSPRPPWRPVAGEGRIRASALNCRCGSVRPSVVFMASFSQRIAVTMSVSPWRMNRPKKPSQRGRSKRCCPQRDAGSLVLRVRGLLRVLQRQDGPLLADDGLPVAEVRVFDATAEFGGTSAPRSLGLTLRTATSTATLAQRSQPKPRLLRVFNEPRRDDRVWNFSFAHPLALPWRRDDGRGQSTDGRLSSSPFAAIDEALQRG